MLSWARNRLLIVALGALWALFLGVELAGRDFGVYGDEVAYTVPGVRQMAQTGRLLPGRYSYPSLFFYVSLGAALPDAAGAVRDNMHRGVHESTAMSMRDSLVARIDAPRFVPRMRAVFIVAASLTVFWIAALAFAVWQSSATSFVAAALWASSWEIGYHGRWASPQLLMGQFAWLAVLAVTLATQMPEASRARRRWLQWSAVAAAFAAGSLWNGGAALIAALVAVVVSRHAARGAAQSTDPQPFMLMAIFSAVFVAICPAILIDPVRFVGDLAYTFVQYQTHGSNFAVRPGFEQLVRIGEYLALVAFSPSAIASGIVLAFSGIGAALLWRERRFAMVPAGAFMALQLLFLCAIGTFYARNQLILLPGLAVLAAGGFETVRSWCAAQRRWTGVALWLLPATLLGYNARHAWHAVQSIRHRDLMADASQARDVVYRNDRALVLPSPGVVRLLGSSFAGCGGRGGECSSAASDSLVVVRAAELLFGESKVAEWDSVASSLRPGRRFEGFGKLTRQELLTLPPSRLLRPGRQTVIGSFGPLDVNYAYYPNWIASDRIVILTPRRAAEAVCGAPDSSASLPVLRRAVCPPAPVR